MISFALAISAALIAMAIGHVLLAHAFDRFLRRQTDAPDIAPAVRAPSVAIVLSVRGVDPFLRSTIDALDGLEYDDYKVLIVVDHPSDPAWDICQQAASRSTSGRIKVVELTERLETCSLKCSALAQAYEAVKDEGEVLVLADADVVPHATWLRELVAPLCDDEVGIATGNQWFVPSESNLGGMIRSVWNAGAIVPTSMLLHPWAGSCALRMEDVRSSGLVERWRRSIVDDGPIAEAFHAIGRQIKFVPSLVMINKESCDISYCRSYIRRMLTWSRLFENTYPLTVVHALAMETTCIVALVAGLICLVTGQWLAGSAMIGGLAFFWLMNLVAYQRVDRAVQRCVAGRQKSWPTRSWRAWLRLAIAVPVTHLFYAVGAVEACFVRQVKWRNVTYRIEGKDQVRLMSYAPYPSSGKAAEAELSL